MTGSMLELVRTNVERLYGRATWVALVGGVGAPATTGGQSAAGSQRGRRPDNAPSDALACWIGRQAVARAAREWPTLLDTSGRLRPFLINLGGRTGALAPDGVREIPLVVEVHPSVDDDLFVTVDGAGDCCALVEGLIAGAAEHYGERVRLELLKCCKRGDNRCVIRVGFDVAASEIDYRFAPLSAEDPAGRRARVV